ncbi:MAG: 2'-5' RNA ligase family protein [bacterium]|nr:2'-5' RNA ligase family protein [bacterium]
MRLFIAINFDEATKEAAAASAKLLQQHSLRGNFSSRDNYHITLAFLGETERRRLPKVREAMENCQGREMKLSLQCLLQNKSA